MLLPLAVVALVAAALVWGGARLKPIIARARIRTARVDSGPIEYVITATGKVVPEFE